MIKAFLFDMDGVLVESEEISAEAGVAYFRTLGKDASPSVFSRYLGGGDRAFFNGAASDLGLSSPPYSYEDAAAFFHKEYERRIRGIDISLPGARELVRSARKSGIMTAVASSAEMWKVMLNIEAAGLSPEDFDFIASGGDIKRNKPFPDIYTLCLVKLGVDGSEAVVFEDSLNGIRSGKRAGCHVVGTGSTFPVTMLEEAGADAVVSGLDAILSAGDVSTLLEDKPERRERHIITDEAEKKRAVSLAHKARENAYAPYSGFRVGAALLSAASGKVYSGCNVENSSYGATICAERNAITTAIASEGVIGIEKIAVYSDDDPPAPPCAVCLQVLAEFSKPDTEVLLVTPHSDPIRYRFSELLPIPFIFPTMR